jgi:DNA-binding transcriptional LysR family regulator
MENPVVAKVGRLHRLAVFESAARHSSFTMAARELGITQPGVTRHIRELERSLGRRLFVRHANRMELNDAGVVLLDAVQNGLAAIHAGLIRLEAEDSRFVLALNPGIAQRWVVPRLDDIRSSLFGPADDHRSDLHLRLFDRDHGLCTGPFHAAIHLGRGEWSGFGTEFLFPETVIPLAAPEFADEHRLGPDTSPERLLEVERLHLDGDDRNWMDWSEWFELHHIAVIHQRARVLYNNYALVVQDVLAGRGVALGWDNVTDDLVDNGLLVPVGPTVTKPDSGYYLIWPQEADQDLIDRLRGWLRVQLAGR